MNLNIKDLRMNLFIGRTIIVFIICFLLYTLIKTNIILREEKQRFEILKKEKKGLESRNFILKKEKNELESINIILRKEKNDLKLINFKIIQSHNLDKQAIIKHIQDKRELKNSILLLADITLDINLEKTEIAINYLLKIFPTDKNVIIFQNRIKKIHKENEENKRNMIKLLKGKSKLYDFIKKYRQIPLSINKNKFKESVKNKYVYTIMNIENVIEKQNKYILILNSRPQIKFEVSKETASKTKKMMKVYLIGALSISIDIKNQFMTSKEYIKFCQNANIYIEYKPQSLLKIKANLIEN